jgi:nicotinamide mononucleotide transporter
MADWLAAHWVEVIGFGTGAACVLLAGLRNIWTFPIGIANNIVFAVLFVESALYADAGLQVVYLVLGVQGWLIWSRNPGAVRRDDLAIRRAPTRAIPWLIVSAFALTALLAWVLSTFTDSTSEVADAGTTAVSLVAQFMLNRRWIETWFVWMAVDVAYIGLYATKGLWITAALYLLFIGLCGFGLRAWTRARAQRPALVERATGERVSA